MTRTTSALTAAPSSSPARAGRRGRRARPRAAARRRGNAPLRWGAGLLLAILLASAVGVAVLGDPNEQQLADAFAPAGSNGHLAGADPLGRDVLAWCARGVWTSLTVSVAVATLGALIGTAVGVVAGYAGGFVDSLLMRLVDLSLALPPLLLFIAASVVIAPRPETRVVLLTFVAWIPYARRVRERPYIAAARLAGTPAWRICLRHLVPAASTAIVVLFTLQLGYVLLWESGLSFLGLGLQPPNVSLGYMIAQGRDYLASAWWITTVPGLVIVALMLSFNLIGDGLRDAFQLDVEEVGDDR
jgi:peptide/nickel transport system permease protein